MVPSKLQWMGNGIGKGSEKSYVCCCLSCLCFLNYSLKWFLSRISIFTLCTFYSADLNKIWLFFFFFLQLVDWGGGTKISTSSLLLVLFYYISYYLTCLLLSVWIDCNIIFAVMCWLLILLLLILLFKWIIVVDNNYKKCCEDF